MKSQWKLPDTDDDRLAALQAAILNNEMKAENYVLTDGEIIELKVFVKKFEAERAFLHQATEDRTKSIVQYRELLKNAQMYISHFIQVLQLTVIRNEIRVEHLSLYGFEEGKELVLPPLTTEEDILTWGENIIRGEAERLHRGGIPLYNPAIAKVKVHFELFREIVQSLKIFRQNVARIHSKLTEIQQEADNRIENIWNRVEEKTSHLPAAEQREIRKEYKITLQNGEQLNVFD